MIVADFRLLNSECKNNATEKNRMGQIETKIGLKIPKWRFKPLDCHKKRPLRHFINETIPRNLPRHASGLSMFLF